MSDGDIIPIRSDYSVLGRNIEHDPRSRAFALPLTIDRTKWVTRTIRQYDPLPNPNQSIGNCTGCDNAMGFNAVGNRIKGQVLGMDYANVAYSLATSLDPFDGQWPPEDTGSSGLAAAKAAVRLNKGGTYRHIFGGADGVVQAIQDGWTVGVGTWGYTGMFERSNGWRIEPTGIKAGGHQYRMRGYDADRDLVKGRCWWGGFRDFWIKREHLNDLLMDQGDAIVQEIKR
jgi:hypothetical protein